MNGRPMCHARDISEQELKRALDVAHRPDLLSELVQTSRDAFGFFTSHFPHTINYTWLLERLEFLPRGSRVLDVGAGVSPLPLALARRGHRVDCVDGSSIIRSLPVDHEWNEWGFFDYGQLDPQLTASNCNLQAFTPSRLYDIIYSISVLAHIECAEREEALVKMRSLMRSGANLVLSVDLIPASDFLWNRSAGRQVAPPEAHGTIGDLVSFLAALGLHRLEHRLIRNLRHSRTDLLLLEYTLPSR